MRCGHGWTPYGRLPTGSTAMTPAPTPLRRRECCPAGSPTTCCRTRRREEEQLYPRVARLLGGPDPTGAMSRGHVEIEHLVLRLTRLLADIDGQTPEVEDIVEIRRVLYALHGVLELHFAQEEEGVFPLIDESPTPSPPRSPTPPSASTRA